MNANITEYIINDIYAYVVVVMSEEFSLKVANTIPIILYQRQKYKPTHKSMFKILFILVSSFINEKTEAPKITNPNTN